MRTRGPLMPLAAVGALGVRLWLGNVSQGVGAAGARGGRRAEPLQTTAPSTPAPGFPATAHYADVIPTEARATTFGGFQSDCRRPSGAALDRLQASRAPSHRPNRRFGLKRVTTPDGGHHSSPMPGAARAATASSRCTKDAAAIANWWILLTTVCPSGV